MQIGSLTLQSNLFLSPLAGYTNLPFRLAVRELGGLGLATTDLVNARSLIERKPQALKLIETRPADRPLRRQRPARTRTSCAHGASPRSPLAPREVIVNQLPPRGARRPPSLLLRCVVFMSDRLSLL